VTTDESVELVVFVIGGVRYGAALSQVRSVSVADPALDVGRPLGNATVGRRALVFSPAPGVERQLAIDEVSDVRVVPVAHLRRLPLVVAPPPFAIGAWVDGEAPVLLIDLPTLVPSLPENTHVR
jgi:chemotaxis signal transduction protein